MLKLYENAFSPFARKVHIVMEHKQLDFECVDGLLLDGRDALEAVNRRVEVPVLDHDGLVVVNSADIVAYLERAFPEHPVYPGTAAGYVEARAWERCSDTTVDAILVDISYWLWAIRPDSMPDGLLDAARADLHTVYAALETSLEGRDWICGDLSIADMALFPHLSGARLLQVPFDADRYPRLLAWYKRCRRRAIFSDDAARVKSYLRDPTSLNIERERIFWRGDRIEWLLAKGYHGWFVKEIEDGRVTWPGLAVPVS